MRKKGIPSNLQLQLQFLFHIGIQVSRKILNSYIVQAKMLTGTLRLTPQLKKLIF